MPARLSKAEMDKLLGQTPATQADATQLAVRSTMPMRISKEEMDRAIASSSAPLSKVKDIRPTTPPDSSLEAPEKDPLDPSTELGATARGAIQGGTARFGDEIGAAAMMVPEFVGRNLEKAGVIERPTASIEGHVDEEAAQTAQDRERGGLVDAYTKLRDSLREDNKTAAAAHPVKYGLAEMGAGMALPVPGSSLMRAAPMAAKVGLGAAQAGGFGALYGAGGSEADLTKGDVRGLGKDTIEGGAAAVPFGAAGGAASHGFERLGAHFTEKAGERAVQAVGARAGITDRLRKMGIPPEDVPELGLKFLDEGLVPTGLNPFRNPLQQTANKAKAIKMVEGQNIDSVLAAAESTGADFDPSRAQDAMRAKINVRNPLELANATKANKFVDQVGELTPQGEFAVPSWGQANEMKSQAWKGADFSMDTKLAPALYRRAVSGLRDSLQEQVAEATTPAHGAALEKANRRFSTATKADTLSELAQSREVQKQQFSPLRAAVFAAAGMGAGGASGGFGGAGVGSVVAPYIVEQIVKRGPNVAAHFNNLMSKASDSPEAAEALRRFATQLGIKVEDLYGDKLRARFGGE